MPAEMILLRCLELSTIFTTDVKTFDAPHSFVLFNPWLDTPICLHR